MRLLSTISPLVFAQSINVVMKSRHEWGTPTLGLELIQYVAKHSSALEFIEYLKQHDLLSKDSETLYNFLFSQDSKISQFLFDSIDVELAKVSLASHAQAPAVQAFYHYYKETIQPAWNGLRNCSVWVDWSGNQACSIKELKSLNVPKENWKQYY